MSSKSQKVYLFAIYLLATIYFLLAVTSFKDSNYIICGLQVGTGICWLYIAHINENMFKSNKDLDKLYEQLSTLVDSNFYVLMKLKDIEQFTNTVKNSDHAVSVEYVIDRIEEILREEVSNDKV